MKKLFVLIGCMFALASCCDQSANAQSPKISKTYKSEEMKTLITSFFSEQYTDIPTANDALLQAFLKDFPSALEVEWESSGDLFLVEFDLKNVDYTALYNAQGNLLLYRFDIPRSAVPDQVKNVAKKLYNGYRIDDTEKIVTAYDVKYKISLEKGEAESDIIFNEDGSIFN